MGEPDPCREPLPRQSRYVTGRLVASVTASLRECPTAEHSTADFNSELH